VGRSRSVTSERLGNWWQEAAQELGVDIPSSRQTPLPVHLIPQPGEHPTAFLRRTLPSASLIPTGPRHMAVWDWVAELKAGQPARSRVEIWGRGGAKSSTAEMACAYLACTLARRFVLYVCGTQDQADLHVQAIASLMEQMGIPRAVNAYSASVNWTAQRLQTSNGFGVVGVGLNSRVRGARLGEFRPDLIILDDIDETHDSQTAVAKKLKTVTSAVLAAGATYATALFIQNKIHEESIIAQVADGRAEILLGATVTQEPAVRNLEYERVETAEGPRYRVTGGEATWPEGQGLTVAEKQINEWGLQVFLSESQHEDAPNGGLFDMPVAKAMAYGSWQGPKKGRRYLVGIDPNFGGKDNFVAQVWDCTESPVALAAEYAEADRTIETSVESVSRLIEDYGPEIVAVESNSGGRIVLEQLIRLFPSVRIEGVTTTAASKKVNTDRIALAIESREVTYPPEWQGLTEMMHFGLMQREALSGKDDRVMAMAAAWVFFHELDPKGRARKRGQWLRNI
jgi:hypothetical protein